VPCSSEDVGPTDRPQRKMSRCLEVVALLETVDLVDAAEVVGAARHSDLAAGVGGCCARDAGAGFSSRRRENALEERENLLRRLPASA